MSILFVVFVSDYEGIWNVHRCLCYCCQFALLTYTARSVVKGGCSLENDVHIYVTVFSGPPCLLVCLREPWHCCLLLPVKDNSAFHHSGVGKWVPASAGKATAGMVHSVSGWTRGVHCAGKNCEIPWERVPYPSALEVWLQQGAIQIHVYL